MSGRHLKLIDHNISLSILNSDNHITCTVSIICDCLIPKNAIKFNGILTIKFNTAPFISFIINS